MRLAKHTRRPDIFRPPRYRPNDLSSQGSTRPDVNRSEDDLSDDGDARSNDADGGFNEAIEPLVEPPAPNAVKAPAAPAQAPAAPAEAPTVLAEARVKATTKRTKKTSFDACVLGGKPIRPKVAALPKPPRAEEGNVPPRGLYQQVGEGGEGTAD